MSAAKVTYALLAGAGPVTAMVGARIYPVVVPQGTPLPAIAHDVVSAVRTGAIDAYAPTHLTVSRVQVNLLTATHADLMTLMDAVRAALQFQRGAINGITVHSVLHAGEGPAQYDQQLGLFMQPVDFLITHEAT